MGYFAKLSKENFVIKVHCLDNNVFTINQIEDENVGSIFLNDLHKTNNIYKQTSYNTRGGVHYQADNNTPSIDQSKSFRKNYAGIGYYYDEQRDAFIPPKPYPSWILNENTCLWDTPLPYPNMDIIPIQYQLYNRYFWNEDVINWVLQKPFESWQLSDEYYYYISPIPYPNDENNYYWNEETLNWELII